MKMDTNKIRSHRFLFIITVAIYVAFGLVTSVIGVIIDKFQVQYNIPLHVAALLPFAFYLSYGLFSVPFGVQMDRIGAKAVLILGMVLMTLGCFLLYLSNNWIMVIAMIFLAGIGVTAIQTAGNPFIRELDTPVRYTANLTIIIGVGALGYAFSPLLVPFIQAKGLPWSDVYLIFSIISLILLLLLLTARLPKVTLLEEEKISLAAIGSLLKEPVIITYTLGIFFYVGAEVGTSSYIVIFMEKVHSFGNNISLWDKGTFMYLAFPSASALIVGLFWLFQALGRLFTGQLMKVVRPRSIFIFHSAGTCIALLVAIFSPAKIALIAFALTGYFTCASFTSVFSGAIQSFDRYHGAISGILCTAIAGGAIIGFLVGTVGGSFGMRTAMIVNLIAFFYVFAISVWGKGKLNIA
jgi:FHS family L-fucose permease-like MFS transporter